MSGSFPHTPPIVNPFRPLLFACLSLLPFEAKAAVTAFSFTSSSSSWVGGGDSYTILQGDPNFSFRLISSTANYFNLLIYSQNSPYGPGWDPLGESAYNYWNIEMAAPAGTSLDIGSYPNASRYPFQLPTRPGLTFSGNHRGNNMLSGYFTVLEATFDISGNLSAFAANFTQYDEMQSEWWNIGTVRFNSSIPVPESGTSVSLLLCVSVQMLVRRRSRLAE